MAEEKNGYTSEQCKYRLMRLLQRNFSLEIERDRYYTRHFFFKLLDGVEVSEDAYLNFCNVMEDDMDYSARHGFNKADDVTDAALSEKRGTLVNAFAEIGIDLVINKYFSSGELIFTKPDGTVMTYTITDGKNNFYINAVSGQEINYARQSTADYQLMDMEIKELNDFNWQMASKDVYWEYDAETQTMTITGTGPYRGVTKEEQLGSGVYTTLIIGAEIPELSYNEAYNSSGLTTLVLLQPADFPLVISLIDGSYARVWDVYTDNQAVWEHTWNESMTVNLHTLDEWEG